MVQYSNICFIHFLNSSVRFQIETWRDNLATMYFGVVQFSDTLQKLIGSCHGTNGETSTGFLKASWRTSRQVAMESMLDTFQGGVVFKTSFSCSPPFGLAWLGGTGSVSTPRSWSSSIDSTVEIIRSILEGPVLRKHIAKLLAYRPMLNPVACLQHVQAPKEGPLDKYVPATFLLE